MAGVSPLIFLHIPKTAGTTVHHVLHNEYRGLKFFTSGNYKQIEKFEKLSDEEKKKIRLLKGHFPFGVHEIYPEPITYFTFFRDPIKRSISGFNYLYLQKTHAFHEEILREKYTLKDILKGGKLKVFDNCHVRYLANAIDLEFGAVDEKVYETALKNFDSYFQSFGICERFDESLIYLKRQLNWSAPYYIKDNVSDKKKFVSEFDEETIQLLNHYNKYDLLLYKHACEKFDAIVRSSGKEFSDEVEHFKKMNALQAPLRKLVRGVWKFFRKFNRN